MSTLEQHHPWVVAYSRGLLLVGAFVAIAWGLDSAGMDSLVGRAVFLAVMISVIGAWVSWEKKRRERTQR